MVLERKIAVIHRDESLASVMADIARNCGFEATIMLVGRKTQPTQVADFVAESNAGLVLLAENYQGSQLGPDPLNRGEKIGEGVKAVAEIRGRGLTTPVFMVSGSPLYKDAAMRQGANGYLDLSLVRSSASFKQFLESNYQS